MPNNRQQHQIDPSYPRGAKRAIQQLARTLDMRMDHVDRQDTVINFFVHFLADQNIILNTNGMFEGRLPTFHTIDRNGNPDSRTFQFHELQQQALKDMLTHNFDNFKIRNDARQQNRKDAHETISERLVSWRNRAVAAENEINNMIAANGNAGNDTDDVHDFNHNQANNEQVIDDQIQPVVAEAQAEDEQVIDDQIAEVQAENNLADEAQEEIGNDTAENAQIADVAADNNIEAEQPQAADDGNQSYAPASYRTAYPNGKSDGTDTATEKVDQAPGLETNRKSTSKTPAGAKAETPIKIQPKTSTPIIKKGATAPFPLTTFPVDRLGLNLKKQRTRERVQTWLDSDPEAENLPITPEYAPGISEVEFNDEPEDADLPPTPEFNPTEDIAIDEVKVNGENVKTKNQLITAVLGS